MAQELVFAYWNFRGLGQTARVILAYSGLKWKDVSQKYAQRQQWSKDRSEIGFQFPNLPYLIDGDFKLTESQAIHRYVIAKSGKKQQLLGKDIKEQAVINMLYGVVKDLKEPLSKLIISKDNQPQREEFRGKVKAKLDLLAAFAGQNSFLNGKLSYVDFFLQQVGNYVQRVFPQEYKAYPFLQRQREAFNKVPQIQVYYKSQKSMRAPFVPSFAYLSF